MYVHDYRCPSLKSSPKVVQLEWDNIRLRDQQKRFPYHLAFRAHWTPSIGNNVVQNLAPFSLLLNQITIEQNKLECLVNLTVQARNIIEINSFIQTIEQSIMIIEKLWDDPFRI